jgi:predicted metalloprotease with PDZ domain
MPTPQITYTIAMPQPHTHLYEVSIAAGGLSNAQCDFVLPTWTPGSYMVREFARHVQEFSAEADGQPLPWRKVDKQTWRVENAGAARVTVRYKVYAHELTVRTSHLDSSHGYFNGATVFMYIPGRTSEPLALRVEAPEGWQVTTGLEEIRDSRSEIAGRQGSSDLRSSISNLQYHAYVAADYDELVDCPVECGTHRLLTFEVDGIEHRIAIWGRGNEDEQRLVSDTKRIVEVQRDMFGGLPYRHYTFILLLADGRGGLEHRNSVSNLLNRWDFKPARGYESFLGLQSHEFFHVWNVKRIRAEPLGPFDYTRENYTRQLWAMEGVTSYYTNLLLVRAGLMTPARYLETVADSIVSLQSLPGRALQSLEESSFDAWIKFYRPDENSNNTSLSYYQKGSLVALLLDMEIRARTGGERSLDDVLRLLFETYPISGPGIPEDGGYREAVERVAGDDFGPFFARYIAGTAELDYDAALAHAGLALRWTHKEPRPNGQPPAWLGINVRAEGGRLKVASARSNGPAYAAGVSAGDEIVALDGWRVDESRLNARVGERAPGDNVTLSVFRRDELLHIPVTLAAAPFDKLALARVEKPSELQERVYRDWLRAGNG